MEIPLPFEDHHQVRTVTIAGGPWFIAADVCRVLGIRNPSAAVSRLDPDERELLPPRRGFRGPGTVIVSESGVYDLIFKSRKPAAKPLRRRLCHVVLPAIFKHVEPGARVVEDDAASNC
jgi:prophage antirepressor-like protein